MVYYAYTGVDTALGNVGFVINLVILKCRSMYFHYLFQSYWSKIVLIETCLEGFSSGDREKRGCTCLRENMNLKEKANIYIYMGGLGFEEQALSIFISTRELGRKLIIFSLFLIERQQEYCILRSYISQAEKEYSRVSSNMVKSQCSHSFSY